MFMMRPTSPPWFRNRACLFLSKEKGKAVIHTWYEVNADDYDDQDCDDFGLKRR